MNTMGKPTERTSARAPESNTERPFVGSRLRQLRKERGISQARLAEILDLSASYVNQIEHDGRPLTAAVLERITAAFGIDPTFFADQDLSLIHI